MQVSENIVVNIPQKKKISIILYIQLSANYNGDANPQRSTSSSCSRWDIVTKPIYGNWLQFYDKFVKIPTP